MVTLISLVALTGPFAPPQQDLPADKPAKTSLAPVGSGPFKLGIYGDHFSLVNNAKRVVERYALADPLTKKPKALSFRRDKMFVTWDERGLTINNGRRIYSTKLEAIPVSPRLRKRDDILKTLDNKYDTAVSAVTGGRRLGSFVYFIGRWQQPATPSPRIWLEALVRVNINDPEARPETLAVVDGASFSAAPVEDNLSVSGDKLVLPVHKGPDWGIWTYDPANLEATYTKVGTGIKYAKALSDGSVGFVEKTSTGSFLAGTVDAATLERHEDLESPSPLQFVGTEAPGLVRSLNSADDDAKQDELHWLEDGRTIPLPAGAKVRRGTIAVVVWTGGSTPVRAWVYGAQTGRPVATWPGAKKPPVVDGGAAL